MNNYNCQTSGYNTDYGTGQGTYTPFPYPNYQINYNAYDAKLNRIIELLEKIVECQQAIYFKRD